MTKFNIIKQFLGYTIIKVKIMNIKGLLIAHRGLFNNKTIPENSLAAFRKAKNLNIPSELDVQLTKDNVIIVFHDMNLKRMCGVDKYISDMTYDEIRRLSLLSTKEKIPTFREVLELTNGSVLLDIEIKKTNRVEFACNRILEELKKYQGDVLLKSFHPSIVRYLKKKSTYPVGLLVTEYPPSKLYSYLISSSFLVKYCHPDFLAINKNIIKKKRLQYYRKKMPLFVWSILSQRELDTFSDYADSFLCNDLPYLNSN